MKKLFLLMGLLCSTLAYSMSGTQVVERAERCIRLSPMAMPKDQVMELLHQVQMQGFVAQLGGEDLRPKFVDLQGCIEQVLAHLPDPVVGLILAPMPATPLCTVPEAIDPLLLDPSMRTNQEALFTVRSRSHILRDYLGAAHTLYMVYPQGGLQQRTDSQRAVYLALVAQSRDTLIDRPVPIAQLDPAIIGATYFFRTEDGLWVFSIQSHQANAPESVAQWAVWFGPATQPAIAARVDQIFHYLAPLGLNKSQVLSNVI